MSDRPAAPEVAESERVVAIDKKPKLLVSFLAVASLEP
jgi:hypothetical protein